MPPIVLVVLASMAFAVSSPLAKLVVGLSPIGIAAGRTLVASLAIVAIVPRQTVRSLAALRSKECALLVGSGLLLAAHFACFLGGLATTSLPAAVALVSIEPLTVVLAAWVAFGIRPTRREGVGVLTATVGGIVVAQGAGVGEHRLAGDLLVLVAVALYGAYVAVARGLRDAMPVLPFAAATYGVAALALLPFALWLVQGSPPPPASAWACVVALGLVPTLIGHTLVQRAARSVSPSMVALVSPGETIGSMLIGAAVLHAIPTGIESIGALLIVAGATVAVVK